jgi:serine/threonine protein kinase
VLRKRTILEKQELQHTITEKNVLQKLVHPFLVNLYWVFQTREKMYVQ